MAISILARGNRESNQYGQTRGGEKRQFASADVTLSRIRTERTTYGDKQRDIEQTGRQADAVGRMICIHTLTLKWVRFNIK